MTTDLWTILIFVAISMILKNNFRDNQQHTAFHDILVDIL